MFKKPQLFCFMAVIALLLTQSGLSHASILTEDAAIQAAAPAASAEPLLDRSDWSILLPGIAYTGGDARLTLVAPGLTVAAVAGGAVSFNGVAGTPIESLPSGVSYDIRSFLTEGLNTLKLSVDKSVLKDVSALSFVISTASVPGTNPGSGANTGNSGTGANTGNTTGNTTGTTPPPVNPPVNPGNSQTPNDQPIPNPEPATMILLGSGLTGLLAAARRAKKA